MNFYNIKIVNNNKIMFTGNVVVDFANRLYGICTNDGNIFFKVEGYLKEKELFLEFNDILLTFKASKCDIAPFKILDIADYFQSDNLSDNKYYVELIDLKKLKDNIILDEGTKLIKKMK